jgi:hypothetical protein
VSPSGFVERTPERGLVRERRGADRTDAYICRDAIRRESEFPEDLGVRGIVAIILSLGYEAVK